MLIFSNPSIDDNLVECGMLSDADIISSVQNDDLNSHAEKNGRTNFKVEDRRNWYFFIK